MMSYNQSAVPSVAVKPEQKHKPTPTFITRDAKGSLQVDNLSVKNIADACGKTPFYLTSKSQLTANFEAYKTALEGLDSAFIGYAVKANHNMHILRYLASLGCGAVLVSGNELKTAIKAGFDNSKMVFNGNGKMQEELDFAVENGVLVNIDSEFDLDHIIAAGKKTGKKARTLLRINPDIDPKVHKYVSTGMATSKFGIENTKIKAYLHKIRSNSDHVELLGAHCHIGSTIKDVTVFKDAADKMVEFIELIQKEGFNLEYLNLGGGLGVDYERKGEWILTPSDLIDSVRDQVKQMDLKLIVEPGHSMVGNTTFFINRVLGVKSNGVKNFIVTDGSMSELIRPSLYNAYHHIELAEPCTGEVKTFDVVGPVCESADFLGKDRELPTPPEGAYLVVFDAGAYCQAMSSVYNMKMTCPEFWVDGDRLFQVRKETSLDDYLSIYGSMPMEVNMCS